MSAARLFKRGGPWWMAAGAALVLAGVLSFPGALGLVRTVPLKTPVAGAGYLLSSDLPRGVPRLRDRSILFPDVPVVREDGRPLPLAMAGRKEVEGGGYGRYRIAGETVMFSTSDGGLPDGRTYDLVAPMFQVREPILLAVWIFAFLSLGVAAQASPAACRFMAKWRSPLAGLALLAVLVAALGIAPVTTADQFFAGMLVPAVWALAMGLLSVGSGAGWRIVLVAAGLLPGAAMWIHYGVAAASHDSFLVGGVIPWSDAGLHFAQAAGIALDGHTPVAFNGRFLYPAWFSVLLRITGFHLQAANFLVASAALASLALTCRILHARLGTPGTAGFALLCWLYFRVHGCGLVMTEGLGLACGMLGLACLLQAGTVPRGRLLFLGIAMLAVGSSARPGALFILPALALFAGVRFFLASNASPLRRLASASAATLLALALCAAAFAGNRVMMGALYDGQPKAFGNFAFTLNGLLTGTKWDVSYEATNGDSEAVMHQNISLLWAEPGRLIAGISRAYGELLEKGFLFRFGSEKRLARATLLLAAFGLAACWLLPGWRPDALWITLAAAGIFASIPFAPPWDAEVRPYAATVPIQSLLPAVGAAFLSFLWTRASVRLAGLVFLRLPSQPEPIAPAPAVPSVPRVTAFACAVLLATVFPAPLALAHFAGGRPPQEFWPPEFSSGSSVLISSRETPGRISLQVFRSGLSTFVANRAQEGRDLASLAGEFVLGINWNDLQSYAIALPVPADPPAFVPKLLVRTDPSLLAAPKPSSPVGPEATEGR